MIKREREREEVFTAAFPPLTNSISKKSAGDDDDDSVLSLPYPDDPVVKSDHCPNQRSARYGNSGWESECEAREPEKWMEARWQILVDCRFIGEDLTSTYYTEPKIMA